MRLSRELVGYTAKMVVQRLIANEMIETSLVAEVTERVERVMLDELAIEDRINEKVREYMAKYSEEIRRGGVSYQEMFKKIKSELVRRGKVIL